MTGSHVGLSNQARQRRPGTSSSIFISYCSLSFITVLNVFTVFAVQGKRRISFLSIIEPINGESGLLPTELGPTKPPKSKSGNF